MKTTQGSLAALATATLAEGAHDHSQHVLQGQKLVAEHRANMQKLAAAHRANVLDGVVSDVRPAHPTAVGSELEVGTDVCITGFIMDNYCIYETGGTLLDNPTVRTLEGPEQHNYFCLIDVEPCVKSNFQVLGPKDPDTGMHCPGFRLDEATQHIIEIAFADEKAKNECPETGGYCKGFAATIKGKIKEAGDGSETRQGPPLLTDIQVLDKSVGCDGADTVPPLCAAAASEPETEPVPAPTPEAEPAPAPAPTPDTEPAPPAPESDAEPDAEPSGASAAQVWLGALVFVASTFLEIVRN